MEIVALFVFLHLMAKAFAGSEDGRISINRTDEEDAGVITSRTGGGMILQPRVECGDLQVKMQADQNVIPWFDKEFYITMPKPGEGFGVDDDGEPMPNPSLSCSLNGEESEERVDLDQVLVEWLFYPEYVNLGDLEKDYKRITEKNKESELMEQPCRFPVSNQVPSYPVDQTIPMCKEKAVRSVAATIAHTHDRFHSTLTFNKPIVAHTGTYQCRWRWREESHCLNATSEDGEKLSKHDVSTVHLLGHNSHRSATLYVKVYKLKSYFEDIATTVVASGALLVLLIVLWCLDSHLKNINLHYVPAEHL